MTRSCTVVVVFLLLAAASFFTDSTSVIAGADKVAFPAYQTHVLYDVLDQPENKEVRELYVNPEALKNLKQGQPLPSGTVLSAPTFKALLDEKGEFVRDVNGRLIRGRLDRVVVMEKRAGWGTEYPEELRNGEWEYARFGSEGKPSANVNYTACFQCHKPKAELDFVFSYAQLLKHAR
jgi:Cytochrome P460